MEIQILLTGIPGDFFTPASLGTLAGATGAVYIICNSIQKVFNYNPKWLALVVALLISFTGALMSDLPGQQVSKYFIALLNGFLIYATATGTNQITAPARNQMHPAGSTRLPAAARTFLSSWW